MRTQKIWLAVVGAFAVSIGAACWLPEYRLDREIEAARSEGLLTELSDIPKAIRTRYPTGENAAPIVRQAIVESKKRGLRARDLRPLSPVLKGTATPADRAELRTKLQKNLDFLALWRRASRCARLDFERDWSSGYGVLFRELPDLKGAARVLAAAAALGIEPRENLLAAARLSALTNQEPSLIASLVSISMAKITLNEAKKEGLAKEVDRALGPAIDTRWAYAGEFPAGLDTMRRVGSPGWYKELGTGDDRTLLERIRNSGPWKANAAYRYVRDYRAFWKSLPKDSSDYDGTIRSFKRWMPSVKADMAVASPIIVELLGGDGDEWKFVQSVKTLEAERRSVRK